MVLKDKTPGSPALRFEESNPGEITVDIQQSSTVATVPASFNRYPNSYSTTSDGSAPDIHSNPKILSEAYTHITRGNLSQLLSMDIDLSKIIWENGDTVLHRAAKAGQAKIITAVLPNTGDLIKRRNLMGDLAFHVAAETGQMDSLRALTNWKSYSDLVGITNSVLLIQNEEGKTPLHIALENNFPEMALYLITICWEACITLDSEAVSPLYLAIQEEQEDIVRTMMRYTSDHEDVSDAALLKSKSVVNAVIDTRNIGILRIIIKCHKVLLDKLDEKGRRPLSYAAYRGYMEGVEYLLEQGYTLMNMPDSDGSYAIHAAASEGHVEVLKRLSAMKRLLNGKGQSILHLAAQSGKSHVVSYLLSKEFDFEDMINRKDEDRNTALHLAALAFRPRVVYILTNDTRVKLNLHNKDGFTAHDVARQPSRSVSTLEERITLMILNYSKVPVTESSSSTPGESLDEGNIEKHKERPKDTSNSLGAPSVVATLVATVTFAAGFTLPGGYNQTDPNLGMATLAKKWAFMVFVVCNTLAMYSSILATVTLLWAQEGERKLQLFSTKLAMRVLGLALSMMSVAFMMGVFVVLSNRPWLSYLVLSIGCIFLLVILVMYIPIISSYNNNNRFHRRLYRLWFLLLLKISESIPNQP